MSRELAPCTPTLTFRRAGRGLLRETLAFRRAGRGLLRETRAPRSTRARKKVVTGTLQATYRLRWCNPVHEPDPGDAQQSFYHSRRAGAARADLFAMRVELTVSATSLLWTRTLRLCASAGAQGALPGRGELEGEEHSPRLSAAPSPGPPDGPTCLLRRSSPSAPECPNHPPSHPQRMPRPPRAMEFNALSGRSRLGHSCVGVACWTSRRTSAPHGESW